MCGVRRLGGISVQFSGCEVSSVSVSVSVSAVQGKDEESPAAAGNKNRQLIPHFLG